MALGQNQTGISGEFRTAIETKAASSLLRLSPIKHIESKQDAADLAPKPCLIAAQAIEREVGHIGKAEKAASEFDCRIIRSVRARNRMHLVLRGCI